MKSLVVFWIKILNSFLKSFNFELSKKSLINSFKALWSLKLDYLGQNGKNVTSLRIQWMYDVTTHSIIRLWVQIWAHSKVRNKSWQLLLFLTLKFELTFVLKTTNFQCKTTVFPNIHSFYTNCVSQVRVWHNFTVI